MTAPLYDVEEALRHAASYRMKRDELATATAQLADNLAAHMRQHFGPEAVETAGLALVIAAASIGGLDIQLPIAANIVGLAGQRLVTDARLADGAAHG